MTAPDEDPQEAFAAEMAKTRDLVKAREESRRRAEWVRKIRIANGFDRLIADLLGGTR